MIAFQVKRLSNGISLSLLCVFLFVGQLSAAQSAFKEIQFDSKFGFSSPSSWSSLEPGLQYYFKDWMSVSLRPQFLYSFDQTEWAFGGATEVLTHLLTPMYNKSNIWTALGAGLEWNEWVHTQVYSVLHLGWERAKYRTGVGVKLALIQTEKTSPQLSVFWVLGQSGFR